MHQEDAITLLIAWMRDPQYLKGHSSYGYDVYLPSLIRAHLRITGTPHENVEPELGRIIPVFYAAAWELCRRGIIRPGINSYTAQATQDGSAGNGYSITPFGRQWVDEHDRDDFVPTEPQRFAEMLKPFKERFGPGFYERAQEAIRCYGAHAYLACCAMCGGAAESIILSIAITKKDEASILKTYSSSGGRGRVEKIITANLNEYQKREYQGYTNLIKYWRDESSHGKKSDIQDNEAFTSIALLLRLAKFVNDNWNNLIK